MLDATAHILASGEDLTTNRVAEVAGVSIGSLYQYFPSKEALIAALVERMLAEDLAWADELLDEGPLRPQVRRVVGIACERHGGQAQLMAAVVPMLPALDRDALARRTFQQITAWLLERLRQDPQLRPDLREDPARLEKAVFVTTCGMRWVMNEAATQEPAWLGDPAFHDEVARLFDGLFALDGAT